MNGWFCAKNLLIYSFICTYDGERVKSGEVAACGTAVATLHIERISQEFPVLSVGRNGLPALNWTQKCKCRLEICDCV